VFLDQVEDVFPGVGRSFIVCTTVLDVMFIGAGDAEKGF